MLDQSVEQVIVALQRNMVSWPGALTKSTARITYRWHRKDGHPRHDVIHWFAVNILNLAPQILIYQLTLACWVIMPLC